MWQSQDSTPKSHLALVALLTLALRKGALWLPHKVLLLDGPYAPALCKTPLLLHEAIPQASRLQGLVYRQL